MVGGGDGNVGIVGGHGAVRVVNQLSLPLPRMWKIGKTMALKVYGNSEHVAHKNENE